MKPKFGPLILSLMAGICFVLAFVKPLVCSDFNLDRMPYLDRADEIVSQPCEEIVDIVRDRAGEVDLEIDIPFVDVDIDEILEDLFGDSRVWTRAIDACEITMEGHMQGVAYYLLDRQLGEVRDPRNDDDLDWESCVEEVEDGADTTRLGSCCENEDTALQTCMKWWMIDQSGVPIGDQYLLEIIARLFDTKDIALGLMLVLFSVCFPLMKIGMCIRLSLQSAEKSSMRFLSLTAKWSMTDVFVIALLICFFKADSFNFRFEASTGVYFFAAGAILSSIAVMWLERSFSERKTETKPQSEAG